MGEKSKCVGGGGWGVINCMYFKTEEMFTNLFNKMRVDV